METLLEKVKVQVDRSTVNLPEDRKILQEFGKIWKKVYEILRISPDKFPKYTNLIKKVADSAKTGMIDKLAGTFTFMGKKFNVEVDKSKYSEHAPTPWKISFAGNIRENKMDESLICEFPHGDYDARGIEAIDFRIEKLPISQDQKKKLAKNFLSGKGIIGRLPKSNKLILFKPDGMKIIKQEPKNKDMILPVDWSKYATILKDNLGELKMNKVNRSKLKEIIRGMVREVMLEKWNKEGVQLEADKKPSAGLSAKQKSDVVKKAKSGEDIGKSGKEFKNIAAKAAKKYGSKEKGEKVAAAAMWKNIKR